MFKLALTEHLDHLFIPNQVALKDGRRGKAFEKIRRHGTGETRRILVIAKAFHELAFLGWGERPSGAVGLGFGDVLPHHVSAWETARVLGGYTLAVHNLAFCI